MLFVIFNYRLEPDYRHRICPEMNILYVKLGYLCLPIGANPSKTWCTILGHILSMLTPVHSSIFKKTTTKNMEPTSLFKLKLIITFNCTDFLKKNMWANLH